MKKINKKLRWGVILIAMCLVSCLAVNVFATPSIDDLHGGVSSTIVKSTPKITVKTTSKTSKVSTLKKKSQSFNIGAKTNSKGTLSCKKLSGNAKITVGKAGKVTLEKGLKKGTYKVKIKITAKANGNYKAGNKTVTVKVVVK